MRRRFQESRGPGGIRNTTGRHSWGTSIQTPASRPARSQSRRCTHRFLPAKVREVDFLKLAELWEGDFLRDRGKCTRRV